MNESFGKEYKLCSQKAIDHLFELKRQVKHYPFLVHYAPMDLPEGATFQIAIAAPKRSFRKAHDRNRIKRLCRESIRRQKHELEDLLKKNNQRLAIFLIYTAREELPWDVIRNKMAILLQKLTQELKHHEE